MNDEDIDDEPASDEPKLLLRMRRYRIPRWGVIHVGANEARECELYDSFGPVPVAFVEANPEVCARARANLAPYPRQRLFEALCADRDGEEVTFHVDAGAKSGSSSMLAPGLIAELHPWMRFDRTIRLRTMRLDTLLSPHYRPSDFNLAVIDTQGADLMVLEGMGAFLDALDLVKVEVADKPLYVGGASFDDVYRFMDAQGFWLARLRMNHLRWGDAYFVRRALNHLAETRAAISIGKPCAMSSTHRDHVAANGVDGEPGDPMTFKCFCTRLEDAPWWKVDLGAVIALDRITLYDNVRYPDRSRTLVVETSLEGEAWRVVYDRARTQAPLESVTNIADPGPARFVRLRLTERNYLQMRQVAAIARRGGAPAPASVEAAAVG